MPSNKKLLQAAAGNAGESLYVEDVFSTYIYDGNNTTNAIVNGLDLAGEGGMLWTKRRDGSKDNRIWDTERGRAVALISNTTAANGATSTASEDLISFNSNGFTFGANAHYGQNSTSQNFASWAFRKAEKFFDVQTYTGNGSDQDISHNLGSTPGFVIIKATSTTGNWSCWHSALNAISRNYILLNETNQAGGNTVRDVNSSTFEVYGNYPDEGSNGVSYVAYLFASDAGGFGDDGSESIIKCGSFTVDGSGYSPNVELGFEPQWVLMKPATVNGTVWLIMDTMRGWVNNGTAADDANLRPSETDAEAVNDIGWPYSTGFYAGYRGNPGAEWIYIAIRRPMKTPEAGTEVFAVDNGNGSDNSPGFISGFPIDMGIRKVTTGSGSFVTSRLTGLSYLRAETNAAEVASTSATTDYMNGWASFTPQADQYSWMFKRATGFMDAVAYIGANSNGNQSLAVNHNLGVVPEFIICKNRGRAAGGWISYHKDLNGGVNPQDYYIYLERTTAAGGPDGIAWGTSGGGGVAPTSTNFTVGGYYDNGYAGDTYISYLFATVAGVSKVGSYTGTGSDLNVDCGFSAGARFILIKRTDGTGDWHVWDSLRGITAGNDPYLLLNSIAAEVTNTDYIDPLSSGFTVTSSAPAALNASGGSYIFLAIA